MCVNVQLFGPLKYYHSRLELLSLWVLFSLSLFHIKMNSLLHLYHVGLQMRLPSFCFICPCQIVPVRSLFYHILYIHSKDIILLFLILCLKGIETVLGNFIGISFSRTCISPHEILTVS